MSAPLVLADRVAETASNVSNTSPVALGGAWDGSYDTFVGALGVTGALVPYCIRHRSSGQWEYGYGVLATGPDTITRAVVKRNSSHTLTKIVFAAGAVDVFLDVGTEDLPVLDADDRGISFFDFNATPGFQHTLFGSRGTKAAPTALQANDVIGEYGFGGYGATGFSNRARASVGASAAENWTDTHQGADLLFRVTPLLGTTLATKARLTSEGVFLVGTDPGGSALVRAASAQFTSMTGTVTGAASLNLLLTGGTLTGNLLFSTDNTKDIGAITATRPRTGYFGTSVMVGDGAVATPAFTFWGDTGTGMYREANPRLSFALNGVIVRSFSTTAESSYLPPHATAMTTVLADGSMNLSSLTWYTTSDTNLRFKYKGADATVRYGDIGFTTTAGNTLFNGSVILGTDPGGSRSLRLGASARIGGILELSNGSASAPSYTFAGDNTTGMYWLSGPLLMFATGGVDRAIFSGFYNKLYASTYVYGAASGNADAVLYLTSLGSNVYSRLYFQNGASTNVVASIIASGTSGTAAGDGLLFYDAGQHNFTTGKVVIGTDPGGSLFLRVGGGAYLNGAVTMNGALTGVTTYAGSGVMTLTDATDSTSISTGAVKTAGGIGITKALWVGGLANIAGAVTLSKDYAVGVGTINLSSADPVARFYVTGGTADKRTLEWRLVGAAGYEGLQFRKVNDASNVFTSLAYFWNSGGVRIGTDAVTDPGATNLFVEGTLTLGGSMGIVIYSEVSASANAYKELRFTSKSGSNYYGGSFRGGLDAGGSGEARIQVHDGATPIDAIIIDSIGRLALVQLLTAGAGITIASGQHLKLGNTRAAGVLVQAGSVTMKDAAGTTVTVLTT